MSKISKIYEIGATHYLTRHGSGKYKKYPNRSKMYKQAVAMSSLTPNVKRRVYYNTNKESGDTLGKSNNRALKQEDVILNVFFGSNKLTPEEVLRFSGLNVPLTSIRRAITNLTKEGKLVKTDTMKKGSYGKMVHTWQKK